MNAISKYFHTHRALSFGALFATFIVIEAVTSFSRLAFSAELLDINIADVDAIAETLDGIGPAKAQAIVEYRDQNGVFVTIDDLSKVPGIGDSILERIRSLITIDGEVATQ